MIQYALILDIVKDKRFNIDERRSILMSNIDTFLGYDKSLSELSLKELRDINLTIGITILAAGIIDIFKGNNHD